MLDYNKYIHTYPGLCVLTVSKGILNRISDLWSHFIGDGYRFEAIFGAMGVGLLLNFHSYFMCGISVCALNASCPLWEPRDY